MVKPEKQKLLTLKTFFTAEGISFPSRTQLKTRVTRVTVCTRRLTEDVPHKILLLYWLVQMVTWLKMATMKRGITASPTVGECNGLGGLLLRRTRLWINKFWNRKSLQHIKFIHVHCTGGLFRLQHDFRVQMSLRKHSKWYLDVLWDWFWTSQDSNVTLSHSYCWICYGCGNKQLYPYNHT